MVSLHDGIEPNPLAEPVPSVGREPPHPVIESLLRAIGADPAAAKLVHRRAFQCVRRIVAQPRLERLYRGGWFRTQDVANPAEKAG